MGDTLLAIWDGFLPPTHVVKNENDPAPMKIHGE